jgi:hypothetical protein
VRFLFGEVRADGRLEIDELTLPEAVREQYEAGKKVSASYLFEVSVSVRGKPWQLHRRTAAENSAILRKYDELFPRDPATGTRSPDYAASPTMFNVFLDMKQSQDKKTLSFAADICIRATEYEVAGMLFFKNYFEGGYLFRDMVTLQATPPQDEDGEWAIVYQFANQRTEGWKTAAVTQNDDEVLTFEIPIVQTARPGVKARLCVKTTFWNEWHSVHS